MLTNTKQRLFTWRVLFIEATRTLALIGYGGEFLQSLEMYNVTQKFSPHGISHAMDTKKKLRANCLFFFLFL